MGNAPARKASIYKDLESWIQDGNYTATPHLSLQGIRKRIDCTLIEQKLMNFLPRRRKVVVPSQQQVQQFQQSQQQLNPLQQQQQPLQQQQHHGFQLPLLYESDMDYKRRVVEFLTLNLFETVYPPLIFEYIARFTLVPQPLPAAVQQQQQVQVQNFNNVNTFNNALFNNSTVFNNNNALFNNINNFNNFNNNFNNNAANDSPTAVSFKPIPVSLVITNLSRIWLAPDSYSSSITSSSSLTSTSIFNHLFNNNQQQQQQQQLQGNNNIGNNIGNNLLTTHIPTITTSWDKQLTTNYNNNSNNNNSNNSNNSNINSNSNNQSNNSTIVPPPVFNYSTIQVGIQIGSAYLQWYSGDSLVHITHASTIIDRHQSSSNSSSSSNNSSGNDNSNDSGNSNNNNDNTSNNNTIATIIPLKSIIGPQTLKMLRTISAIVAAFNSSYSYTTTNSGNGNINSLTFVMEIINSLNLLNMAPSSFANVLKNISIYYNQPTITNNSSNQQHVGLQYKWKCPITSTGSNDNNDSIGNNNNSNVTTVFTTSTQVEEFERKWLLSVFKQHMSHGISPSSSSSNSPVTVLSPTATVASIASINSPHNIITNSNSSGIEQQQQQGVGNIVVDNNNEQQQQQDREALSTLRVLFTKLYPVDAAVLKAYHTALLVQELVSQYTNNNNIVANNNSGTPTTPNSGMESASGNSSSSCNSSSSLSFSKQQLLVTINKERVPLTLLQRINSILL